MLVKATPGMFTSSPSRTLGPCHCCGRKVDILEEHLKAIMYLVRVVAPYPGQFVMDLDTFGGTDWTRRSVPMSAYAKVVMGGEWLAPVEGLL